MSFESTFSTSTGMENLTGNIFSNRLGCFAYINNITK